MWKDMFVKRKYATLKLTEEEIKKVDDQDNQEDLNNYITVRVAESDVNSEIFMKCPKCGEILIKMELDEKLHVCSKCNHHLRIDSEKRIAYTFDDATVKYFDENMKSLNPIEYPKYTEKTRQLRKELKINDAVLTG